MPLRYLFGPVTGAFAEHNLAAPRRAGVCLAFGPDGDADLRVRAGDSWDDLRRRWPVGWEPDFLALYPARATVPHCLWRVPLLRVAVADDWEVLWHSYRDRLARCDLVLADAPGADALAREGVRARPAFLSGCARPLDDVESPAAEVGLRDLDLLLLGDLPVAGGRDLAPWLTRLARLGRRWRVRLAAGPLDDAAGRLLRRARVAFFFSATGRATRGAVEAAAAGALVFQEAGNRELPARLRDRRECVYYRADDLEELADYYLTHEDERRALAEAGAARARACRFADLWQAQVDALEGDWPRWRDRAGRPALADAWQDLSLRAWQDFTASRPDDLALMADLERAPRAAPEAAAAANLAGCLLWRHGNGRDPATVLGDAAAACFRRALEAQPAFALAALNLAEALDAAGRRDEAVAAARQALEVLHRSPELDAHSRDGLPLCRPCDALHAAWERAAWAAAGSPSAEAAAKRELLLGRLHRLLAAWTGELSHHYEAALCGPDDPSARAALGAALARAERPQEALEHLRRAVASDPLDRAAARDCFHALGAARDADGQRRLAEERRLLARAAPHAVPVEPWFAEPRLRGGELVSLVALLDDRPGHDGDCLERLLLHARPPWELILVESADDAGVGALEDLLRRAAPARVELVRAGGGFARRCNQGLGRARGRFVAFLEAGVAVTPGWLECLLALALHDWPTAGLVGPTTGATPPPQGVATDYADRDGLDGFAARRRRGWSGRMASVPWLSGACLLARREVLERVGPFDERFVGERCAAADLCLRVRDAGLRLLLAQDAFVHRTDPEEVATEADAEAFRFKWGAEAADPVLAAGVAAAPVAATELPALVAEGPPRSGVSLCMIVRNEEANLPQCLATVEGIFDEIVIADTGSTDGTVAVARRFGARVVDFPWQDSFSAARNAGLEHATGRWVMWLDADDRLDEDNRQRLRRLLAGLGDERDAYAVQVRSVLDPEGSAFRLLDQVRLFRNLAEVRWDYRIHEQILPAVHRVGGGVRWTDMIVDHVGYQDAALRRRKLERNLRLLELDAVERPNDAFSLFNLGWTLLDLGRATDALPRLQASLAAARADASILRKLHHLLAVTRRQLGDPEGALRSCRDGLGRFPDDAELLLEEGLMLRDRGDLGGAEASWSRLFGPRGGKYFASEEVGLRGFRSRHLLAEVLARQERWAEAEVQWRAALAERGDFEPAWQGLAELCLRLGRWPELEGLLATLERQGVASPRLGWLRARGQVQRREYAAARATLAEVIGRDPKALGPRVLLSQALLQEGRDWAAAERALLDVLELEPAHADTQHNLRLLRRRWGAAAPAGADEGSQAAAP